MAPSHEKWHPVEYQRNSAMQERHASEALLRRRAALDDRILDVGCGDGRITARLARSAPAGRVLGIDHSGEMIAFARRHKSADLTNLEFEIMSADAIQLEERFTHVVSFSCLHWVHDQRAVWEGFRKQLEPGGVALVGFQTDHEHLWPAVATLTAESRWCRFFTDFEDPFNHWTLLELRSFAEGSGFYVPRADDILAVEAFGDRATLSAFLASWMPHVAHLPEDLRLPFLDQLLDRYLATVEEPIRSVAGIRIRRLILEAVKPNHF